MIQPLPRPDAVLDRDCEGRLKPGFLDAVIASADYRVVLLQAGKTLVRDSAVAYLKPDQAAELTQDGPAVPTIYLGATTAQNPVPGLPPGTQLVLQVRDDDADAAGVPAGTSWRGYREVATELPAADTGVLIQALAVANWHRSHTHCPRCGTPTTIEAAGWVRRCPRDNSEHYPRTDPAIIVAVVGKDDRLLLAGNSRWEENRYSTLAGFVEPGESLEQAVVREIGEEVGIAVHTPQYLGSQAWPFPASLMLGYLAHTDDVHTTPDGVEVVRTRWFTRDELQAAVTAGDVVISQRMSIARSLIEHWYGGRIADAGEEK